jgi:hypothetical protein
MSEYFAVVGSRFTDDDARVIGPELEVLAAAGKATAEGIVDAAREADSALHRYFEWDDAKAGHQYRLVQARYLARSIEVRLETRKGQEQVRAFHAIATEDKEPRAYVTVAAVLDSKDMSEQVLADARRQLIGWKARFATYAATFPKFRETFGPVLDWIDEQEQNQGAEPS